MNAESPRADDPAIELIESSVVETDPQTRWPQMVAMASAQTLSPAVYRELWDRCFVDWDPARGPAPVWFPSAAELEQSNLAIWARELSLPDYAAFHRWSIERRAEFWGQAIDRVGITFRTPPREVLDLQKGAANAVWLPGAVLNIAESCFQADPEAIAIRAQRPGEAMRQWSYRELRQRANRVANSLVAAGLQSGDAIAVVMPMTDWSVAIYLGILLAGCQAVSIADSFAPPEIATRLKIANAKAVLTYDHQRRSGKQLPLFQRVAEATVVPAIVLACDGELSVSLRDQDVAWDRFLVEDDSFEPVPCSAESTVNVLFSSGTTGDPKAIPWTQLTPIKCAVDGYCHHDIREGDVCAWPTNLGWMMGPWLIFASLINRATIALYEDAPMGAGFGRFVQDAQVTLLGVVPTIVKAWQASGEMEAFDWSRIKAFSSTGESSHPDAMFYLSALAQIKPIIEYCGGTEIGGGYVSSVVMVPNVPAAFNTPAVGLDFVLVQPSDDGIDDGEADEGGDGRGGDGSNKTTEPELGGGCDSLVDEGEVFLIPPSIGLSDRLLNRDHFQTYYAGTPTVEACGPLRRHGDYFRRIATFWGFVYVACGRSDDTMNLGGIKVSSAEIERELNLLEGVLETAAVAFSESGPDQLVVFAVLQPGAKSDVTAWLQDMNRTIKQTLNPLFRVHSVRILSEMPRTASGKVMRRSLRKQITAPPA